MITSLQDLRNLYARHCSCQPLNIQRTDAEHPDLNCDLGILADVRAAFDGDYAAVKRCDRYMRGDYTAYKENTH